MNKGIFAAWLALSFAACGAYIAPPGTGPGIGEPSNFTTAEFGSIMVMSYFNPLSSVVSQLSLPDQLQLIPPGTYSSNCEEGGHGTLTVSTTNASGFRTYSTNYSACAARQDSLSDPLFTITGSSRFVAHVSETGEFDGEVNVSIHHSVSSEIIGVAVNCELTGLDGSATGGECVFTGSDGVVKTFSYVELSNALGSTF